MAGQLIYQDGASVSQVVPNEITPTGYFIVHYLGEDPFAVGPGPDLWRPRWTEGHGAKTPAPDWQVDADPGAAILVCMRTGPAPGEPYLFVQILREFEATLSISAVSDGTTLARLDVPIPDTGASELRVLMQSGQVTVADQDGVPLVVATAAEVAGLFASSPEPFDAALLFPYAFDASNGGGIRGDGLRKVYYGGTGGEVAGFWANFVLCAEIP